MPTPAPHKQPHQTQWEKVKLGDIGEVITGKTPSTDKLEYWDSKDYMFITPPDLKRGTTIYQASRYISAKGLQSIKTNSISGFSILVGCIGSDLGNIACVDSTCATNQQINALTNIKPQCNTHYVYHYLTLLKKYFRQIAAITTAPIVSKSMFENIKIPLPPLPTQENIAQILSTLDKKIELNTRINTELESMAKLLYTRYFVEFNFPDSSGKPYKASGGAMVYSPTLKREIPQDWEVAKIGDLCDVITGKEDANFATKNGKFAFFTCGSEILRCDIPKFNAKAVLIAGNGSFNIKYFEGAFNAYQRTYILIPKEHLVGLFYMCCKQYCEIFMKRSNGSIVKFITKGDIENIPIPLPKNLDLLNTLNKILSFTNHLWQESQQLAEWRDYLLPLLMGDQVEVV